MLWERKACVAFVVLAVLSASHGKKHDESDDQSSPPAVKKFLDALIETLTCSGPYSQNIKISGGDLQKFGKSLFDYASIVSKGEGAKDPDAIALAIAEPVVKCFDEISTTDFLKMNGGGLGQFLSDAKVLKNGNAKKLAKAYAKQISCKAENMNDPNDPTSLFNILPMSYVDFTKKKHLFNLKAIHSIKDTFVKAVLAVAQTSGNGHC